MESPLCSAEIGISLKMQFEANLLINNALSLVSSIIYLLTLIACCRFTGLAYVDLKNLRHDNIVRKEDGKQWIVLNRQKTGSTSYIPLLDIPLRLIEKYWDTAFAGFTGKVFRLCTIENADIQLKKIAKAANIDKLLTYHMARHSYATLCLSMGVPIETISQTLGHRSISTTQIYADITRTKINEDMTNLAERIEGRYELSKFNF